jgi:hypothetical protein
MNRWKSAALFVLIALTPSSDLVADDNPPGDPVVLLAPNGPFSVGQTLLEWTDDTRAEPGTENPDDHRHIPVQIWYPAPDGAAGKRAPYRPRAEAFRSYWGDETVDFFNSVQTSWIFDAPVNPNGPFPVFVFSHGWGARSSSHGTFLANVASHGYIVVGINHPFLGRVALASGEVTEPDDSQFDDQRSANEFYAADVAFVLDTVSQLNEHDPNGRFTGTIDIARACAGGHSSGFPAVSGAAVTDKRIKALISFDSGVPQLVRREGLDVPILLFRGETGSYTDLFFRGENVHPKGTIYDVDFFRVHREDFFDVVVSGTTHSSVYDEYLFAENDEERERSVRAHITFASYTEAFLDHVLKGTDSSLLRIDASGEPNAKLRIIPALQRLSP